jgi:hypothetical protein
MHPRRRAMRVMVMMAVMQSRDFDRFGGTLRREIEDGLERVFAFNGDVHGRQPFIKAERAGRCSGRRV